MVIVYCTPKTLFSLFVKAPIFGLPGWALDRAEMCRDLELGLGLGPWVFVPWAYICESFLG